MRSQRKPITFNMQANTNTAKESKAAPCADTPIMELTIEKATLLKKAQKAAKNIAIGITVIVGILYALWLWWALSVSHTQIALSTLVFVVFYGFCMSVRLPHYRLPHRIAHQMPQKIVLCEDGIFFDKTHFYFSDIKSIIMDHPAYIDGYGLQTTNRFARIVILAEHKKHRFLVKDLTLKKALVSDAFGDYTLLCMMMTKLSKSTWHFLKDGFWDIRFGGFSWFVYEEAWKCFCSVMDLHTERISVFLETKEGLCILEHLYADREQFIQKASRYAAEELLEDANVYGFDTWANEILHENGLAPMAEAEFLAWLEEHGQGKSYSPLTVEGLLERITPMSICITGDHFYVLEFDDGDLFWGHHISVCGNVEEGFLRAEIA